MEIWNKRIKELRKMNGFTLKEIADKLGTTEATAQRYESTIKNIPYDVILKYAEIFDCNPSVIMGWSAPETKQESVEQAKKELEFEDLFSQLNDNDKKEIIQIMKLKIKNYGD